MGGGDVLGTQKPLKLLSFFFTHVLKNVLKFLGGGETKIIQLDEIFFLCSRNLKFCENYFYIPRGDESIIDGHLVHLSCKLEIWRTTQFEMI